MLLSMQTFMNQQASDSALLLDTHSVKHVLPIVPQYTNTICCVSISLYN